MYTPDSRYLKSLAASVALKHCAPSTTNTNDPGDTTQRNPSRLSTTIGENSTIIAATPASGGPTGRGGHLASQMNKQKESIQLNTTQRKHAAHVNENNAAAGGGGRAIDSFFTSSPSPVAAAPPQGHQPQGGRSGGAATNLTPNPSRRLDTGEDSNLHPEQQPSRNAPGQGSTTPWYRHLFPEGTGTRQQHQPRKANSVSDPPQSTSRRGTSEQGLPGSGEVLGENAGPGPQAQAPQETPKPPSREAPPQPNTGSPPKPAPPAPPHSKLHARAVAELQGEESKSTGLTSPTRRRGDGSPPRAGPLLGLVPTPAPAPTPTPAAPTTVAANPAMSPLRPSTVSSAPVNGRGTRLGPVGVPPPQPGAGMGLASVGLMPPAEYPEAPQPTGTVFVPTEGRNQGDAIFDPRVSSSAAGVLVVGGEMNRLMEAARRRIDECERRLTHHQNDHVKQRAGLTLEIDKSRWESDQSDFRLAELESTLETLIRSVRQRLESRVSTIKQLRGDNTTQLHSLIDAELKSIPPTHGIEFRDRARTDQLGVLDATVGQLGNKLEVEVMSFDRSLGDCFDGPMHRCQALNHVVDRHAAIQQNSLNSMYTMIEQFTGQTRKQLEELKYEREQFEEHFRARVERLADIDPRTVGN